MQRQITPRRGEEVDEGDGDPREREGQDEPVERRGAAEQRVALEAPRPEHVCSGGVRSLEPAFIILGFPNNNKYGCLFWAVPLLEVWPM